MTGSAHGVNQAMADAHAGNAIAVDGEVCSRKDVPAVLGARLDALPRQVGETKRVKLGTYRGLGFGLVLRPQFSPDLIWRAGRLASPCWHGSTQGRDRC